MTARLLLVNWYRENAAKKIDPYREWIQAGARDLGLKLEILAKFDLGPLPGGDYDGLIVSGSRQMIGRGQVEAVRLLREAFMKLLDASIEEAGQMDIMKALARHYGVFCDFANIRTRTAGRRQFVDLTLILPAGLSIKKAHGHAADLKNDLAASIPESEIVVHMEPCAGDCAYAAEGRACPYLVPAGKNGA